MTDSSTVHKWVSNVLNGDNRVKTKGAEEIIIKWRLGVISALMNELQLEMKTVLVPSEKN